ncbi:hypothetical protein BC332_16893 [Capsicum chinense]|nr:hypothetical protein BC332_16893 [Capsicum chinense]
MIRRIIFEKLGLENYLNEHKNSGDYLLGLLKYRPPKDGEKNVGLTPHTDKTISTILSQYDQHVNGLQIMDKNGQFIDVQYSSPHSYLFLVSDCLKRFRLRNSVDRGEGVRHLSIPWFNHGHLVPLLTGVPVNFTGELDGDGDGDGEGRVS